MKRCGSESTAEDFGRASVGVNEGHLCLCLFALSFFAFSFCLFLFAFCLFPSLWPCLLSGPALPFCLFARRSREGSQEKDTAKAAKTARADGRRRTQHARRVHETYMYSVRSSSVRPLRYTGAARRCREDGWVSWSPA